MKKIIIIMIILLTFVGCSAGQQKDNGGEGENAYVRCKEAFDGLKNNDENEMMLFSYPGLDSNQQFFLSSEQGLRLRSYMSYKVTKMEEDESDEDCQTCELTVTITSIDLQKVIEEYEKLDQLPLNKATLLEAIDNSKSTTVTNTVTVEAELYPNIDIWRINLNSDVFNALFPNYDKYLEWFS